MDFKTLKVFSWNFRGASNFKFHSTFNKYMRIHHPNVVAIFELKISGLKADRA